MSFTNEQRNDFAARLHQAARTGTQVPMLTSEVDFKVHEAYAIQETLIEKRIEEGFPLVGMKMGLTSLAKMQQMGVESPIYGHLTADMLLDDGETLDLSPYGQPRVEPEIAFILDQDVQGPITSAQVNTVVRGVCAALEIIDSRYENFKFTLPDVVADNASSTRFVLGSELRSVEDVDLGNLGMVLEVNGEPVQIGSSAAIYEHPMRSLSTLVNMLAKREQGLKAGQIILAGAATAAVPLAPGQRVRVRVQSLGEASFFTK
jgi:2-oxo-3-hexenedioate decarboxylase